MASVAGQLPVLISVKAADFSQYPYYGRVELNPANAHLDSSSIAASDELLQRLHLTTSGTLRIGQRDFRIAARIVREPDRMTTGFSLGPRVLITRDALENTGIVS